MIGQGWQSLHIPVRSTVQTLWPLPLVDCKLMTIKESRDGQGRTPRKMEKWGTGLLGAETSGATFWIYTEFGEFARHSPVVFLVIRHQASING